MTGEDLKSTLDRLHQDLASHPNLDRDTAASLGALAKEIESILNRDQAFDPGEAKEQSLTGRLQGMITEFELQHPKITNTLSMIAERLSDMGI
jgi:hypothetical protein